MLWKNVTRVLIGATVVGAITACYSLQGKEDQARTPSSTECAGSVYDNFSHKGCEEVSHRNMTPGRKIAPEQLAAELSGREIWYKSAPNGRFHTYAFTQRLNTPINWYRVLRTDQRFQRFNIWGTMNDPDCCTPGKDCDSKGLKYQNRSVSMQDTFGLDYCPGDEKLLGFVGSDKDYLKEDPACDSATVSAADKLNGSLKENACHLAFGTSTGAIGFRKFPNPRFNKARWDKLQGWKGYTEREVEGSIEPPFRVGISCASCHASFEPTNPPKDVNHPEWSNISGIVGNQYLRITDVLSSGTKTSALENQLFGPTARPGTSDTSAVPNDFTGNSGTINAIINFPQRPLFKEKVNRWFNVQKCDESKEDCQAISYANKQKKYWHKETRDMEIFHILKGGEDSVAPDLAVQRVYLNIGMCAEQCWMNHHADMRALHPGDRGFGQTPFDIAQCRRDCAPWRANEDRITDIVSFLLSARPSDLKVALKNQSVISGGEAAEVDANFNEYLEKRFKGSIEKGRELFAQNCATCHSSQNIVKDDLTQNTDNFANVDFHAETTLPSGEIIRADWMGNDKSTGQDFIQTFQCRARHSNHMKGHVWEEFASDQYRSKPSTQFNTKGEKIAGGIGYYRNISLLNVWAYAPFLHNNALGPEICGKPSPIKSENLEKYVNTYSDLKDADCQKFDPSIEGRLKLFSSSMDELLTSDKNRRQKVSRATTTVRLPVGLDVRSIGQAPRKLYLNFPAGTPMNLIGSFNIKAFAADLLGSMAVAKNKEAFGKYWSTKPGGAQVGAAVAGLLGNLQQVQDLPSVAAFMDKLQVAANGISDPNNPMNIVLRYYSNCPDYVENKGHNILVDLDQDSKNALKAFMATL